jgi:hypothetical protein
MLRIRIQSGRYNFAGYTVQNIGNYDIYDDDEKEKTMKTGTAVNKSKENFRFSNMFKTYRRGRIRIGIWIGIKMESGIRIGLWDYLASNYANPKHSTSLSCQLGFLPFTYWTFQK